MKKLMYVRHDDENGESSDLLVVAESKDQAIKMWREYYILHVSVDPTWVGVVPGVVPECELGPIDWDAIQMD